MTANDVKNEAFYISRTRKDQLINQANCRRHRDIPRNRSDSLTIPAALQLMGLAIIRYLNETFQKRPCFTLLF